jgi:hypothetical protein
VDARRLLFGALPLDARLDRRGPRPAFDPPASVISPFSGRLIGRFGARRLIGAGMAFGVAGLLVLTQVGASSSYGLILAGYLLFGIALGLTWALVRDTEPAGPDPAVAGEPAAKELQHHWHHRRFHL